MPTIKKLQFANGTTVTEPVDLSLESSTNKLETYADDAAYVTANGPANDGDIYINTTTGSTRLYVNGQWWTAVIKEDAIIVDTSFALVDNGDGTKKAQFDVSNVAAGTTKTYAVPAISTSSDVLVAADATQELKNKTIDGNLNTLTNLDFGTLSGEVNPQNGGTGISNPAGATLTRTGAFDLNITCTAETDVTMPVSGTLATLGDITTTQITGTLAPAKGGLGTDASAFNGVVKADGAGNFSASSVTNTDVSATAAIARSKVASGTASHVVINDGTGVLSSEATLSKTRGGSGQDNTNLTFPATGTLATLAGSESLSSKTLVEPIIDNFLTFNEEASGPAVVSGGKVAVYAKEDGKIYKKDDTQTETEIGGSGTGTGRNYLQDWFDGSKPIGTVLTGFTATGNRSFSGGANLQWGASSTSNMTIGTETVNPLRQTSCIKIDSLNTTSGAFVETPVFALDNADLGKPISIEFDIGDIAASTSYDIVVMQYAPNGVYEATIPVAGNASTGSPASAQLPTGTTKFRGFFIPAGDASHYYSFRFRKLAAVDDDFLIDSLFVGPQSLAQGAVVTGWQSYTPTLTSSGGGAITLNSIGKIDPIGKWRRVGDSVEISIGFFNGTGGPATGNAGNILLGLPSNLTIDSSKIDSIISWINPVGYGSFASGGGYANAQIAFYQISTQKILLIKGATASGYAVADLVSSAAMTLKITLPVAEWSSGITTLADRAVEEYASNSNTNDVNDSSSFVNGINGSPLPGALTALRTKRVQFTTPILPTDALILEVSFDRVKWSEVLVDDSGNALDFQAQNPSTYGMSIRQTSGLASNQINVQFGTYAVSTNTIYGQAGAGWNLLSPGYWRVRKVSGGAAVGFPIAPANITLLDTTDNYSGNTKLGLMQYRHGFAGGYFGGIAPTVTCPQAGFTVLRAVFVPYQMADGIWRLKFNLQGDFTSASVQTITVSVNGILMSASYTQSISAIYGGNSTGLKSYALINSNQLQTTTTASITANGVCLSGDVELAAKPTWAY